MTSTAHEDQFLPHPDDVAQVPAKGADVVLPLHWQAFQFNSGWGTWEQVIPSAADEQGVVTTYTADQVRAAVLADREKRGGSEALSRQERQVADLILSHFEGARVSSPIKTRTGFGDDVEHYFEISDGQDRYGVVIIITELKPFAALSATKGGSK